MKKLLFLALILVAIFFVWMISRFAIEKPRPEPRFNFPEENTIPPQNAPQGLDLKG